MSFAYVYLYFVDSLCLCGFVGCGRGFRWIRACTHAFPGKIRKFVALRDL